MQTKILAVALALTGYASASALNKRAATNFNAYTDDACQNYRATISTDETDGSCQQMSDVMSVLTSSVHSGCTVTVYTDSNCSDDPTTAGLGTCVGGANIGSYSVDC